MKIQTKFSLGDRVYYLDKNQICSGIIEAVHIFLYKEPVPRDVVYFLEGVNEQHYDDELFTTKEKLIKHLIANEKTK